MYLFTSLRVKETDSSAVCCIDRYAVRMMRLTGIGNIFVINSERVVRKNKQATQETYGILCITLVVSSFSSFAW